MSLRKSAMMACLAGAFQAARRKSRPAGSASAESGWKPDFRFRSDGLLLVCGNAETCPCGSKLLQLPTPDRDIVFNRFANFAQPAFFQDARRRIALRQGMRANQLHRRFPASDRNQCCCGFGCIPFPLVFGGDTVGDLNHSRRIRWAGESAYSNNEVLFLFDNCVAKLPRIRSRCCPQTLEKLRGSG